LPTLPEGSIRAEHIWKKFRADQTIPLFQDQMRRLRHSFTDKKQREYRWVLKDVSVDVQPGGSLGLNGINGSGKTTLLKILSKVTYQTAGICTVQGRIGALLSVTAGLHPDLSGRENVYLYGAVLGMSRAGIRKSFDEIVQFAELEDAIDRQVKFYSSGMTVRLGFSIAVHLDPDILMVDEALSVGDSNFQQKCLERIDKIVRSGTTLLFVSHDLASVEATCDNAIWLSDSVMRAAGPTKEVMAMYRSAVQKQATLVDVNSAVTVLKTEIEAVDGGQMRTNCAFDVRLVMESHESETVLFLIGISTGTGFPIFVVDKQATMPEGTFEVTCRLDSLPLPKGSYSVWAGITGYPEGRRDALLPWQPLLSFDAFGPERMKPPQGVMVRTPIYVDAEWQVG
jgi:ABC-2 type transport system ATP-binding protein